MRNGEEVSSTCRLESWARSLPAKVGKRRWTLCAAAAAALGIPGRRKAACALGHRPPGCVQARRGGIRGKRVVCAGLLPPSF